VLREKTVGRLIAGILAAPVLWGMLSVPVNLLLATLYGEAANAPPFPASFLLVSLVLSFAYSAFAGWGAAWIAGLGRNQEASATRLGLLAGAALLVVGIAVQASVWETIPLWWHIAFLVMLIPMCLAGVRLRK